MFTNNIFTRKDDVSDIAKGLLADGARKAEVVNELNRELGISSEKSLPHEKVAGYRREISKRMGEVNELDSSTLKNYTVKRTFGSKPMMDKLREKIAAKKTNEKNSPSRLKAIIKSATSKSVLYRKYGPGQNESVETVNEKVSNAATAALTNRITSGMTKRQADTLHPGDIVTIDGTKYTATKGDTRWRIAQRHLEVQQAAGARVKDDKISQTVPRAPIKQSNIAGARVKDDKISQTVPRAPIKQSNIAGDVGKIAAPIAAAGKKVTSGSDSQPIGAANNNPADNKRQNDMGPASPHNAAQGPRMGGGHITNTANPSVSSRIATATAAPPKTPSPLATALIAKAATARQAQTSQTDLFSRNKKVSPSSILGR